VAALTLGACGSNGDDGKKEPSGTGETNSGGASDTSLDELLGQKFELPYPTKPTDIGKRKITYIVGGIAAGGTAEIAERRKAVIEKAGWEVEGPLDGKFTPSTQATLIEQAVLRKSDGILVDSVFPSAVPGAYKSAKDAGIPIVCTVCMPEPSSDGVYMVSVSADSLVKYQIPLVLAGVGKKDATIALAVDEGTRSVNEANKEQERMLKEQCPDCKLAKINFTPADLGKSSVPSFVDMLRQYPEGKLDAVITPYAPATTALIQIAQQAGRDDFKIFNTYGSPPISTQIKEGQYYPLLFGDVIFSQEFASYASIDALARAINGEEVPDYSNLPAAPITKQNAADYVSKNGDWVPEDMQDKFYEQWGLNK
jgi:ABC-type sugar transport system substrate-binding protein